MISTSFLARQKGLEPPTPSLGGRCSIHLSYWRILLLYIDIQL